ncbi:MAG: hypothetical protein WCG66_07605 [bacterium]
MVEPAEFPFNPNPAELTTIEHWGRRENRKLGKAEGRATESWPAGEVSGANESKNTEDHLFMINLNSAFDQNLDRINKIHRIGLDELQTLGSIPS